MVRALFVRGSQKSFVSKRIREALKVTTRITDRINARRNSWNLMGRKFGNSKTRFKGNRNDLCYRSYHAKYSSGM